MGSLVLFEWDLIKTEVQLITAKCTQIVYSEPDWDKNQNVSGYGSGLRCSNQKYCKLLCHGE